MDVSAVFRRIVIVGRAIRKPPPLARRNETCLLVSRNIGLHIAESALVKRRVDTLPLARRALMQDGEGDAVGGFSSCDLIGQRNGDPLPVCPDRPSDAACR